MKIRIEIDCNNAAFEDHPCELGDILRHLAYLSDNGYGMNDCPIYDINGNLMGRVEIDSPACCLCKR